MITEPNSTAKKALDNLRLRLLDLSAKNSLINFKHSKKNSLRIIDELPDQLANELLADKEMRFIPVPEPKIDELEEAGYIYIDPDTNQTSSTKNYPSAEDWAKHKGLKTEYQVPKPSERETQLEKHQDNAIQVLHYPHEMESKLKNLLQSSQSAILETGANILYMSFGFLQWFEDKAKNPYVAPLFLIPVRIHKGRLNPETSIYEYTLKYSGEDIIPNLSLREKLKNDFSMALPELDELSTPEKYLHKVENLIKFNKPEWQVKRYISLALLNFNKLLMYLDLDPSNWPAGYKITHHPIVSEFLTGREVKSKINKSFNEEHLIDEIDNVHTDYPIIYDADSSQHSAVIDAVKGKNLVIEGPPGTGKSQTITNIIAAAMSQKKRVLFVAEKLAALEVVKNRLDQAGLGDFCLELHSHNSQKRKVLDEINLRLNNKGRYRSPSKINNEISRFEEHKQTLSGHVNLIKSKWKNTGIKIHHIFTSASFYRSLSKINPSELHLENFDGWKLTRDIQRKNKDQIKAYINAYNDISSQLKDKNQIENHPWYGLYNPHLQIFDLENVEKKLLNWQTSLASLSAALTDLYTELDVKDDLFLKSLDELTIIAEDIEKLSKIKKNVDHKSIPRIIGNDLVNVKNYYNLFILIQKEYRDISKKTGSKILENLSKTESYKKSFVLLKRHINSSVKPATIERELYSVKKTYTAILNLSTPIKNIKKALGCSSEKILNMTPAGIKEVKKIIELVVSLPPYCWHYRDSLFENDELDNFLPKLKQEINTLNELENKLKNIFNLKILPDINEIIDLQSEINSKNIFRWFSRSWHKSRNKLKSLSIDNKLKFSKLYSYTNMLIDFINLKNQIKANPDYQRTLGRHAKGSDTDIDMLVSLRNWYKSIRMEYGILSEDRANIGNSIIKLDQKDGQTIRYLYEEGIIYNIEKILNELNSKAGIFNQLNEVVKNNYSIIGEKGINKNFISELEEAFINIKHIINDSMYINDLSELIERLVKLQQNHDKWIKLNFDDTIFKGKLSLQPGIDKPNKKGLLILKHTIEAASLINLRLNSNEAKKMALMNSSEKKFNFLFKQSEKIKKYIVLSREKYNDFRNTTEINYNQWTLSLGKELKNIMKKNKKALNDIPALQNWIDYIRELKRTNDTGFYKITNLVEKGKLKIDQVKNTYLASFFDFLAREVLIENPQLAEFSGSRHQTIQNNFKEYDNRLKTLQCEKIAANIDNIDVPQGYRGGKISEYTELSLLRHECSLKRPKTPIRGLFKRAGNALMSLKPCFMMGPMSVSQYLEAGKFEFDLIIMDEASQIKPEDALSTIARGKQLVVVGDPKQLPPTSFFDRTIESEAYDPTCLEESESILDASIPMFTCRRLRWHYRSQHQSLIAFSNYYFYDSDLILFPSPSKENGSYGIKYSRIKNGCFINRKNIDEAQIITDTLKHHFHNNPDESIGIIAMSSEQRNRIEQTVESLAKEDSEFQKMLESNSEKQESLFIKNLENVQGDERDVIFVSLTYGPKEPGGKVPKRFGPINTDSGWRRMNVLLTRSKKRMHVFSSMDSQDIVIDSKAKKGIKTLKNLLKYCETGKLGDNKVINKNYIESSFEKHLSDILSKEGFKCTPKVGASGFFIDLAVIAPENPGHYLMGIEYDGTTYTSANSTRDRDRLREGVLKNLGWTITRIWSPDWFKNPEAQTAPIIKKLHEIKDLTSSQDKDIINEIENIIQKNNKDYFQPEDFSFHGLDLKDKLIVFDNEVISKKYTNTDKNKKLLRPAVIEALVYYLPCSKSDFFENIPSYLINGTDESEMEFLEYILKIINTTLEESDNIIATSISS
ncbi:MAG: DUF4011 domain-containing anti-phage protein Hhe [Thermotogota bacterium]